MVVLLNFEKQEYWGSVECCQEKDKNEPDNAVDSRQSWGVRWEVTSMDLSDCDNEPQGEYFDFDQE